MIKKITIVFILILLMILLNGCKNNKQKEEQNSEVETNRTSLTVELPENSSKTLNNTETEISTFSTPIFTKTSERQENLRITCSKINNQIIENGAEFSFEKIVGKATPEQGYQKADIFIDKKTIKAYGGGNCQVSSTLYNAVLAIPEITVTERHPHGKKVGYAPEGKDAAVSYGSLDFKFINNTGFKIKIYASTDGTSLTVKIVKIE